MSMIELDISGFI